MQKAARRADIRQAGGVGALGQAPGAEPRGHGRGGHLQERHQDAARAVSLPDFEGPRPGSVDLDAFLHGGTTAPTRGLQALRWISKNAQLQWTLPELRRVKQPKAVGEQQAMVVEPPLLSHLEDRILAMCRARDARWTLLGQWLVGVGVLRYKRLNLSTVLKITPSTVHCFCTKGKQAGVLLVCPHDLLQELCVDQTVG